MGAENYDIKQASYNIAGMNDQEADIHNKANALKNTLARLPQNKVIMPAEFQGYLREFVNICNLISDELDIDVTQYPTFRYIEDVLDPFIHPITFNSEIGSIKFQLFCSQGAYNDIEPAPLRDSVITMIDTLTATITNHLHAVDLASQVVKSNEDEHVNSTESNNTFCVQSSR